eukprot:scaffold104962_cov28-Tisochrysis_lutea.AAC.2
MEGRDRLRVRWGFNRQRSHTPRRASQEKFYHHHIYNSQAYNISKASAPTKPVHNGISLSLLHSLPRSHSSRLRSVSLSLFSSPSPPAFSCLFPSDFSPSPSTVLSPPSPPLHSR